jgi:hypothetical protein
MITLSHGTHTVDIDYPEWEGYSPVITLAIESVETADGYDIWDNGIAYDYRVCKIDRSLLSETDCAALDVFFAGHRTAEIYMDIGTDSNFFPFGPDKGDSGEFTVRLISRKYGSFDQFKQFKKSYDLLMIDAPAYSLPSVTEQADFQIGTVDGLLYPQTDVISDRVYGVTTGISYGGDAGSIDIRRNIHTVSFTQRCNAGLAAELVAFLTGATGRSQDITIIAPDDFYLFDIANGASGTYICKLIQKEIICNQLDYEEWEIPLSFWLKEVT